MNRKQLNYVITLEEEGTTSLAAKKLGVSQSTLSKHLTGLEQELGVPLFIRNQKQLTVTTYGRVYIDAAKRILQLYHFAEQNIMTINGCKKTDLFLGLPDNEDHKLLLYLMNRFAQQFPAVTLHIKSGPLQELLPMLKNNAVSTVLANLIGPLESSFYAVSMTEDELIFVASTDNVGFTDIEDPIRPGYLIAEALRSCALILPFAESPVRTIVESLFQAKHISPHVTCEIESPAARLELVRQGFGCTFLTRSEVTGEDGIVSLKLPESYAVKKVLIFNNEKKLSPPEAWCAELFKEYYRI